MHLFEYVVIAFSLVLSTSVMRLADGIAHAFGARPRYCLYIGQVAVALIGNIAAFWNYWSFHEAAWTFPRFALAIAGPVSLYAGTCTLVPRAPESIASIERHSLAVRRRFYLWLAVWAVLIGLTATVLVDLPFDHPARAIEIVTFAAGVIGASTDRDRVHVGLVVFLLVFATVALLTLGARPAALS
ncbi:MAG: hypothetical protein R3F35_22175 [Myxococcota bacterium]